MVLMSLIMMVTLLVTRRASVLFLLLVFEGFMMLLTISTVKWVAVSMWGSFFMMVMAALEGSIGLALVVHMTRSLGNDSTKGADLMKV